MTDIMMPRLPHPREAEGYAYAEPSDVVGGRVMNADHDGVYIAVGERTFFIALNGQDSPFVEYGKEEAT